MTSTLNEVWRFLTILEKEGYIERVFGYSEEKLPPWESVSLHGVASLVLGEIFHIKYRNGEYKEALTVALDVLWDRGCVEEASSYGGPISPAEMRRIIIEVVGEASHPSNDAPDAEKEKRYEKELEVYETIQMCWSWQGPTPQQVVDCFEALKWQDKSDNWHLVARQCTRLARTIDEDLRELSVFDGNRQEISWYGYWCVAEGWASAQMGQNELRDFWRQQERDASEERLRRYFFGGAWGNIPEKAQGRLVNADNLWFTYARGAAIDAVLNELQVAAETMCYAFIWEPLRQAKGGQELPEFKKRETELNDKNLSPTLYDYAWVCKRPFFKAFVQRLGLNEEQQQFLTSDLEVDLDFLRRGREIVQHDPNRRLRPDDIERLVKLFLGIGEPGVLRRLAEIGPKLTGRRSRHL